MDELTRRAERALLGAMIAAPRLMTSVRIRPEELDDPRHASTLRAMVTALESGQARYPGRWRNSILQADPALTPAHLDDLVAGCPSPDHGPAYASLVIQAWAVRAVKETATSIVSRARLLESDSRHITHAAPGEGLDAAIAARQLQDVATAIHAHASLVGRTPPPLGLIPDTRSPEQAEREEAVLAGLVRQPPGRRHQILATLEDHDIGDPYRRAVLRAIRDMHDSGTAVDPLTLDWELALRGLPLARQPRHDQPGETYTMRLAQLGVNDERPLQAARELAAQHGQPAQPQPARRRNVPTGQREQRSPQPQPPAGRTTPPGLRLIRRPPENGGPQPGPQQGR